LLAAAIAFQSLTMFTETIVSALCIDVNPCGQIGLFVTV